MTTLEEIQEEAWHILVSIYTYQRMIEVTPASLTRYDLANQLVARNALAEMLIIRVARLADLRSDARTISLLLKRSNFAARTNIIENAAEIFNTAAKPVVKIRHEQVAHMKPGVLSSYPLEPLPTEVLRATEALINLIDIAKNQKVSYIYKVGSQEAAIDLRASLESGTVVTA